MLYLLEFLDMVPPKIVGGDKYTWYCYGDNARYLDMEKNVDIIFDEKTQEIYEITIRGDDESNDTNAIWRRSEHEPAYLEEMKDRRNVDKKQINAAKANVSDINDMIERVKKLYESGNIF